MRKIGINLDAYPNIPDEEYIARIAELGFETGVIPYKNEVADGADEVAFSCYVNEETRKKARYNGGGSPSPYWLRSPNTGDQTGFKVMLSNNSTTQYPAATGHSFSFGFCLRQNGGA